MVQVNLWAASAIVAFILLIYHRISKKYHYFLSKPIPCLKPTFLLGSSGPLITFRKDESTHLKDLYNAFPDAKVIGLYDLTKPIYMLRDPEVIKIIGIRDFEYFADHTATLTGGLENMDGDNVFGNTLFALRGDKWRDMRATLSPTFTGSKMRQMFELVADCGRSVTEYLKSEAKSGRRLELEMKDMLSRFTNDVIATVAFGIKVDSLREKENEFYVKGRQLTRFQSIPVVLKYVMIRVMPKIAAKLGVDIVDKDLAAYFRRMISDNMKQREVHGIIRRDMIQMLMEVRKGVQKHQKEETDSGFGFATAQESSIGRASHSREWTENEGGGKWGKINLMAPHYGVYRS